MKITHIFDPFTGLEINEKTLKFNNKDLAIYTPFHGIAKLEYNKFDDTYKIPAYLFRKVKTCSLFEASELLNVSRMRISRLCKDGILKSAKINGNLVISIESIKRYQKDHDRTNNKLDTNNSN